ncbi:MAG: phosphoribosyltransferase family protein [candidate division WOR-3 bacterium]
MKLDQVPLRELELSGGLVRAVTPYILEFAEVEQLAEDVLHTYRRLVNPDTNRLADKERESNADSFRIMAGTRSVGRFNVVYDVDETRLSFELPTEAASKFYRLLREQRIVRPDLLEVRRTMSGNLAETVAAILWQVGAIKVSLGDLRPLFQVDMRKNRSPIYIDVKCLANYPEVNDFVLGSAALLLRNISFDVVCGIEAGSIGIAAVLAHKLAKPAFFARREKRYPEASPFEGIKRHELFRKKVLLVDDTLVHGWTKARIIREIRAWGGVVDACFVIFDRRQGGEKDLADLGVKLWYLTDRRAALSPKIPADISFLTEEEFREVTEYFEDPQAWHQKRDLAYHRLHPPAE